MSTVDLSWWDNPPLIQENTDDVLRRFILEPQIPIHDPDLEILKRIPNPERLYSVPSGPASTTIIPDRCPFTGKILDFVETKLEDAGSTAKNSMSMQRAPGPPEEATRGSAMNFPFWPGGFDEPADTILGFKETGVVDFENNLLTIAPGFNSGLEFQTEIEMSRNGDEEGLGKIESLKIEEVERPVTIDLRSIVDQENDILGMWQAESKPEVTQSAKVTLKVDEQFDETLLEATQSIPVLDISTTETLKTVKTDWAEIIDVTQPLKDFANRIPDPAHTYPFELDTFQKQAIIKLEEHHHVLVAAHTSAGKTVVAEYAIALSQKHMTRAIYTSPIKALSNQKYRDFKHTFKDVGLITGDIQIDPTSSCLIMTTEILRSMLYCGSDVTRDLEYVIFDEVHYITDTERGYVWEEVLILLPDHVSIVMLSATVPNTLEFANWVGQTKRRKVYVISTLKRPVPLKHYLYTGCGGKSRSELFPIVDETGRFLIKGHSNAVEAKNSRKNDFQKSYHQSSNLNIKQEQTLWVGLIEFLRKSDKLPVVAFTLSRNRCDRNVQALKSCDLCTAREKNLIHLFFQRCLQKLKPEDRELPQFIILQDSLKRGIGVHHSGILPILKEIVEMLFQKGLVKLLFATETFAMGVNMPARTVIFDAISKFDGKESRPLRPAEYIQMAGRAGRRGLDENGMVILICKKEVPMQHSLQEMMLGKPMKLISQFRLTYAMILNLLCVEKVTIEDMMAHSFREVGKLSKQPENNKELKAAEKQILSLQALSEHLLPLCQFYDIAFDYISAFNTIMPHVILSQKIWKEMKPGKVLKITCNHHYNKLAILLVVPSATNKEPTFKVLVLDHQETVTKSDEIVLTAINTATSKETAKTTNPLDRGDLWHRMLSLTADKQKFIPEGIGGHSILLIKSTNIVEITKTVIKAEYDMIIQNWAQRQIPRFRDSPPGPSVIKAVNELTNLNNSFIAGDAKLQPINLTQGFDYAKSDIFSTMENFEMLKPKLNEVLPCTKIANFEEEFSIVFDRKHLERKKDELTFKLSSKSLSLYPDYCNKLQVLQELNFIDEQQQVLIKGRVARQMGSNELLITELILRNLLTELDPAEIAALLSSLVFQSKTDVEPKINDSLKKSMKEIVAVDQNISRVEQMFNVGSYDDTQQKDRLNFGLVEVVYEWGRNKPFAEIMKLTDVQEGIIVRCIQQLHEILRDIKGAASKIGNPGLQSKMEEATNVIKRDIVFAASLYTEKETVSVMP